MTKYIALIGDLINSRQIPNRVIFDQSLLDLLSSQSRNNRNIVSPYTLIGDEIQAVYSGGEGIFWDAFKVLALIYPQRMRFSYGLGQLIKPVNIKQAIEMDGPAFYLARDGIDELKNNQTLFNINGLDITKNQMVKNFLFYLSTDIKSWNRTRIKTFSYIVNGFKVKEIASELKVAESTIYKTIKEGNLNIVISIYREIAHSLNQELIQ